MKVLAISGSVRRDSTNTALLRAMAARAPEGVTVELSDTLGELPIFSPDREGDRTPGIVEDWCGRVRDAAGLVVSSPEYVRALPGGLKNAIDWLVSRDEIIAKPIALVHASHRGDDMLESLRRVLGTVSSRFDGANFLRLPLMALGPEEIERFLERSEQRARVDAFWTAYVRFVAHGPD